MVAPLKSKRQYAGNTPQSSSCQWMRCFLICGVVFLFVFLAAPGGDESQVVPVKDSGKSPSLRQGGNAPKQEPVKPRVEDTSSAVEPAKPVNTVDLEPQNPNTNSEASAGDDAIIDEALLEASNDFDEAESDGLTSAKAMLQGALKRAEDFFKFGMGKLFGDEINEDEMEDIADEVSTELEAEVNSELKKKAHSLLNTTKNEFEETVDADLETSNTLKGVIQDMKQIEKESADGLKEDITKEAKVIEDHIKEKAMKIEEDIVNKHLNKKGITVKVKGGQLTKVEELITDKKTTKDVKSQEKGGDTDGDKGNKAESTEVKKGGESKTKNDVEVKKEGDSKDDDKKEKVDKEEKKEEDSTEEEKKEEGNTEEEKKEEGNSEEEKKEEGNTEEEKKEEGNAEEEKKEEGNAEEEKKEEGNAEEEKKEEGNTEEEKKEEGNAEEEKKEEGNAEEEKKEEGNAEEEKKEEGAAEEEKKEEGATEEEKKEEGAAEEEKKEEETKEESTEAEGNPDNVAKEEQESKEES